MLISDTESGGGHIIYRRDAPALPFLQEMLTGHPADLGTWMRTSRKPWFVALTSSRGDNQHINRWGFYIAKASSKS